MWFIPIVNPDGYFYNETIAPDGGGMHRKNRRSNPQNSNCNTGTQQGVDLNRNYGYNWGANNSGSSGNPCSAVYRGSSAFSEPETEAVSNFIADLEQSVSGMDNTMGQTNVPPDTQMAEQAESGMEQEFNTIDTEGEVV